MPLEMPIWLWDNSPWLLHEIDATWNAYLTLGQFAMAIAWNRCHLKCLSDSGTIRHGYCMKQMPLEMPIWLWDNSPWLLHEIDATWNAYLTLGQFAMAIAWNRCQFLQHSNLKEKNEQQSSSLWAWLSISKKKNLAMTIHLKLNWN